MRRRIPLFSTLIPPDALKSKRIPKNYQPPGTAGTESGIASIFSVRIELLIAAASVSGLVTKRYASRRTKRNVIFR
jgi:hypothetical protein